MPKIKPLPSQKIIRILEKTGFRTVPQKGSHIIMIKDKGTRDSNTCTSCERCQAGTD